MGERDSQVGGITIRRSLVRNLVMLVLLVSGAVLALLVYQSNEAVEDLSRSLVRRSTSQVKSELDGFFDPVRRQLRMMADWGAAGTLTPIDPERLTPLALPQLRRQPQISSLMVASDEGHGYMLLQLEDAFRRREVWPDRFDSQARWVELSEAGRPRRRWSEPLDYDPRTRPWFSGAVEARGRTEWSAPYTFFTTREPGITASTTFDDPGSDHQHVIGLDVLLADVSRFTTSLHVSPNGTALVLADDGRVVGLPSDPRFSTEEARREAVLGEVSEIALEGAPAADAWARWQAVGGEDGVFSIETDSGLWWVGMRRYQLSPRRSLWIQVLVPEGDFLGRVNRQRNIIIGIAFGALVLAFLIALALARSYSRPLETLASRAERIRSLDLSKPPPITSKLREVRLLTRAQERMRAALESFSRYVPIEVVRELIRRGEVARLGGRTARLTIMFTDIEGFTTIAERMSPAELTAHVGTYFDAMLGVLGEHGATVDKLIGDAIMAFWGAPVDDPEHARHALEAVLACHERLEELGEEWEAEGLPALPTRFGLHTAEVVVGNVGSRDRLSYTVLGDGVNLAARLEGANKAYGTRTLVSSDFKDAVGEGFEWRLVDRVAVKGRTEPVEIFEPLGRAGEVEQERLRFARAYEEAFALHRRREWEAALARLDELDEDASVRRLKERCERHLQTPPDDDWEAVTRLTTK